MRDFFDFDDVIDDGVDTSAWKTQDGRFIRVEQIDDEHLGNIIGMLERNPVGLFRRTWLTALRAERGHRSTNSITVPRTVGPVYQLRVDRLLEFYNPYPHVLQEDEDRILTGTGVETDHARQHSAEWHAARVRHLAELLVSPGYVPDPIVVNGTRKWVVDGHHRVLAARVAGVETLPSEYSGPPEVRAWLEGA